MANIGPKDKHWCSMHFIHLLSIDELIYWGNIWAKSQGMLPEPNSIQ